ncbi:Uncharacterised protein [Bordetella pertussis]|nr:Uncharacterised protein [Bordetella pertussis]CFU88017.1 Uncharacterised protein [Bordetella pertussis]CPI35012.1 Uncharacterised protein [Bordetella pertussis]CPL99309.1 Uncharacterised protein [Bordetella pertussis]CPM17515.1 Uncharacterised protein [Bordetella pertussis]
MPVAILNDSPIRCSTPQVPELPYEYLPGFFLSSSRKPLKSLAGNLGLTATTLAVLAKLVTGWKSLIGSYGRSLGRQAGLTAMVDTVAIDSV